MISLGYTTEELEVIGTQAMNNVESIMRGASKVRAIHEDTFAAVLFPMIVEKMIGRD